jgi:hypothetical protein
MNNRVTMALIAVAIGWATVGCESTGVGPGESGDAGPHVGVCDGAPATSQAATIHVTRSTNSPELTVTVYCDGSAQRTLGEAGANNSLGVEAKTYAPNSPEVAMFLADLDAVGDVSAIPASPANANLQSDCAKSASFGTVTTVAAQGKTSGDIQCMKDPTSAQTALAADCRVLAPWP